MDRRCRQLVLTLVAIACLAAYGSSAFAQGNRIISESDIRREGLQRRWSAHLAVDPTRAVLREISLHVSSKSSYLFFEVAYQAGSFEFAPMTVGEDGNRLGPNGALTAAEQKLRQLVLLGIKAKLKTATANDVDTHTVSFEDGKLRFRPTDRDSFGVALGEEGIQATAEKRVERMTEAKVTGVATQVNIPRVRMFATASNGVIQAVDGESGRTMWKRRIGDPRYPSFRVATNEDRLAIVNGSTLYMVEQETGRVLWDRAMVGTPGASPALSNFYAFIPTVTGQLEVYDIEKGGLPAAVYQASGRALVRPTVTSRSVTWPTDLGHMYFADSDHPTLRFRLEANQDIVSSAGFLAPNFVYITSVDGYVYCINDVKDQIEWQISLGTAMSQSPLAIGEQVLVTTDEDELICLDAFSGKQVWGPAFNIRQLMSVSEEKIYALDRRGDLVIIHRESGARLRTIRLHGTAIPFVNTLTDRLFLTNKQGRVVCLHEDKNEFPFFHVGMTEAAEEDEDGEGADKDADDMPKKKDPFDTFDP
jgi:outer membrane protein assembly factor BamB